MDSQVTLASRRATSASSLLGKHFAGSCFSLELEESPLDELFKEDELETDELEKEELDCDELEPDEDDDFGTSQKFSPSPASSSEQPGMAVILE